jgi:NAD(P)-dependent dehydrogenase (short-subunit alcohol dehydrogenase family)
VDVRGKTVLVTRAGRGIGRALAAYFAGKAANLALLDMNAADLQETAALCTLEGVTARCYVANAAEENEVIKTLDAIVGDFGRLDGLVNNAGIVRDAMLVKVKDGEITGKMTLAQWQAVIDVNLTGVFLCAREAAERMIRLKSPGVIVNISSISRAGNAGQTIQCGEGGRRRDDRDLGQGTGAAPNPGGRSGPRIYQNTHGRGNETRSLGKGDRPRSVGAAGRSCRNRSGSRIHFRERVLYGGAASSWTGACASRFCMRRIIIVRQ